MHQPEEVRLPERSLISGPLKEMPPICLQLVSGGKLESLCDHLVHTHHYLSCKKLLGKRLKYMAFIQQTPVAAISWSAPAKKLHVRDDFIGWADEIRRRFLHRLAANSRFVIFPWVQIYHLASYLMGRNLRRLRADWKAWFHQDLWLVETFVDPTQFRGTVYKASNWRHVGKTKGYTKCGKGYMYLGQIKEVFVYVLEPRFRDILGISSTLGLNRTLPKKVKDLRLILHIVAWDPNPLNELTLSEQDVYSLVEELTSFHHEFHSCFVRPEQERLGLAHITGLLSNLKAKSIEPMALEIIGEQSVRSMQRFMKTYRWDHQAMLQILQDMVAQSLGSVQGMITVGAFEFPKKRQKIRWSSQAVLRASG